MDAFFTFVSDQYPILDIDMSAICYVASIELRDAYLQKYPEMIPEMPA